ncbi:hypothetical protein OVA24_16375 [Luteolibacter sp. SL250]|uniref:hypothetical protein n=1 Tax=Luteolibacter sp. SL250 TaxID=2995170 RepID=UPI002270750D|nr:hypothetical protein [Luteolibacter sp. SL250]WAC18807.1 hypothetical protein OVA24_16375 [Luteolibacter sp. SL250]
MHAFIKSSFWADSHIENMPPDQKLALVWLMTNAGRDGCGFTAITPRRFTFDTGLPVTVLEEACAATCGSILVLPGNVYFVRAFIRHQFCRGDSLSLKNNVLRAVVKQARRLPAAQQEAFFTEYPELADGQGGAPAEASFHPAPQSTEALPDRGAALPQSTEALPGKNEPLWKGNGTGEEEDVERKEGTEARAVPKQRDDRAASTMDAVVSADDAARKPDAVSIAAMYPRRQSVREAVEQISRHIRNGVDPQVIADGTRAIAEVIRQLPGGHLNAYVPSAGKFFENRRWEDDPRTWLRLTPAKGHHTVRNGAPPEKLSLGGRTGRTIRI